MHGATIKKLLDF